MLSSYSPPYRHGKECLASDRGFQYIHTNVRLEASSLRIAFQTWAQTLTSHATATSSQSPKWDPTSGTGSGRKAPRSSSPAAPTGRSSGRTGPRGTHSSHAASGTRRGPGSTCRNASVSFYRVVKDDFASEIGIFTV